MDLFYVIVPILVVAVVSIAIILIRKIQKPKQQQIIQQPQTIQPQTTQPIQKQLTQQPIQQPQPNIPIKEGETLNQYKNRMRERLNDLRKNRKMDYIKLIANEVALKEQEKEKIRKELEKKQLINDGIPQEATNTCEFNELEFVQGIKENKTPTKTIQNAELDRLMYWKSKIQILRFIMVGSAFMLFLVLVAGF